jgi:flagellar motor switch protein FliG
MVKPIGSTTDRTQARSSATLASKLSGASKVAALLLAMDQNLAARLLKRLNDDDVEAVAQTAMRLGTIPKPVLDELVEEFGERMRRGVDLMPSASAVQGMLAGVLPDERLSEILDHGRVTSTNGVWDQLANVPETQLAEFLANEHPQVAARILSLSPPAHGAATLSLLPPHIRRDIARRMLAMKGISDKAMSLIDEVFREELLEAPIKSTAPVGHAHLASVINKLSREDMDDVLRDLDGYRPKEAEHVRSLLFTFEDIPRLTVAALTTLLDRLTVDQLGTALQGADAQLRETVLNALPIRSRRMLDEELKSAPRQPPKRIAKARRTIADLALAMLKQGVIETEHED